MKLTHLGIEYNDFFGCVVGEDASLSKIRFAEAEAADVSDAEDPLALMDARFVLLTGTLRELLLDLKKILGGYASTTPQQADAA